MGKIITMLVFGMTLFANADNWIKQANQKFVTDTVENVRTNLQAGIDFVQSDLSQAKLDILAVQQQAQDAWMLATTNLVYQLNESNNVFWTVNGTTMYRNEVVDGTTNSVAYPIDIADTLTTLGVYGLISAAQGKADQAYTLAGEANNSAYNANAGLSYHMGDVNSHVTAEEKVAWNNKANLSDVTSQSTVTNIYTSMMSHYGTTNRIMYNVRAATLATTTNAIYQGTPTPYPFGQPCVTYFVVLSSISVGYPFYMQAFNVSTTLKATCPSWPSANYIGKFVVSAEDMYGTAGASYVLGKAGIGNTSATQYRIMISPSTDEEVKKFLEVGYYFE